MDLLDELERRIVYGDGVMGTLLLDRGVPGRLLEFRLNPSVVENVLGQLTESRGTNEDRP
jgi:hypothetical protein